MPSIEEAIQQSEFKNVFQRTHINLLHTAYWVEQHVRQLVMAKSNITVQQYNVLRILRGASPHPLSTRDIRERMLDKMSDASRIVDRLQRKGLVEKQSSTFDRRRVEVVITQAGIDLLEQLAEMETDFELPVRALSEEEAQLLSDLLDRIRQDPPAISSAQKALTSQDKVSA